MDINEKKNHPGTKGLSLEKQKVLLKGDFEIPKAMDATLLHLVTYTSEGYSGYKFATSCQEGSGALTVSFITPEILIFHTAVRYDNGLSGVWKF